jgi:4,5-dihydroxyphthalate decarboxylase
MTAAKLKVLLGDYPFTAPLKSGLVSSPSLSMVFAEAKPLNTAFKRMVRDLEFDISELSLVTFLQAIDAGKPLVLLPAVVMSRFHHHCIVYNAERGELRPEQLSGRRVGCRLYTSNTAVWVRSILASDYGVDLDTVRWAVFQEPHVAEYRDPPNAERVPEGSDLLKLLFEGEVDAIVIDPVPSDPRIKTLIPAPAIAAKSWAGRYRAIQINHMIAAKQSLTKTNPEAVHEFYRLLIESWNEALKADSALEPPPIGLGAASRRSIDLMIECAYRQRLISRRFQVDELFDEITANLGSKPSIQ